MQRIDIWWNSRKNECISFPAWISSWSPLRRIDSPANVFFCPPQFFVPSGFLFLRVCSLSRPNSSDEMIDSHGWPTSLSLSLSLIFHGLPEVSHDKRRRRRSRTFLFFYISSEQRQLCHQGQTKKPRWLYQSFRRREKLYDTEKPPRLLLLLLQTE